MSPRFISLSVKTSKTTIVRFAITENAIRQIPEYSKKLDTAIAKNKSGRRLCISDPKFRKEECMFQAIEYLMHGTLAPLVTEDPAACLVTLHELLDLYDLSVTLNITTLKDAIVQRVNSSNTPDLSTFVAFAIECFKHGAGHEVSAHCALGVYIKQRLRTELLELVKSGASETIKKAGGELSELLTEVLTEEFVRSQKERELSQRYVVLPTGPNGACEFFLRDIE